MTTPVMTWIIRLMTTLVTTSMMRLMTTSVMTLHAYVNDMVDDDAGDAVDVLTSDPCKD